MAGYTLQDVESYARANCPAAFAIINDVKYTFVRNTFVRGDKSTFEGHALHVGYLDREAYGDCWFAVCDPSDGQIATYHGRPGDILVPAGDPFARPATASNVADTVFPFCLAMDYPHSKAKDDVSTRQEKKFRLLLLIQFAHLLTDRLKHLELVSPHRSDILGEFVALCELMQRQNDRIAKKEAKKVARTAEEKAVQASAQAAKPNESTKHPGSSGKRDLKRKAVTNDEPHTSISQGPPKKQRTAPTAGSDNNKVKATTKGASLLKASFARLKEEPATPRPMQFNPGPGVGPRNSNSNAPLVASSINVPIASSSNIIRSSPKSGETITSLRTKLKSANKQLETATKTVQMLERTVSTKDEQVAKAQNEASRTETVAQHWKKMFKEKQPKYETLQAKYEKLKAKYSKLKAEVSNLKLPLDSDSE